MKTGNEAATKLASRAVPRLSVLGCVLALGVVACSDDPAPNALAAAAPTPVAPSGAPVAPTASGAAGSAAMPAMPTAPATPATPTAPASPAPITPPTAAPAPLDPPAAMPPAMQPTMPATPPTAASPFAPVMDFEAPGPFQAVRVEEGPGCTFYHPMNMGLEGVKHPVIVWGNGTGASNTTYQAAHLHFATHGFIVAAANTANSGSGTEMIGCLDFLAAEDAKTDGSTYAGKVDLTKIASSGHSQGGCATFMAGRDMRVTTTAPVEPYVQINLGGCDYDAAIAAQRTPMFMMSGSADTVAVPAQNQAVIFGDAMVPVFWATRDGADHVNSATGNMAGFRGAMTAWFRFQLMNDQEAAKVFSGADCVLCKDTANWSVMKKMFN